MLSNYIISTIIAIAKGSSMCTRIWELSIIIFMCIFGTKIKADFIFVHMYIATHHIMFFDAFIIIMIANCNCANVLQFS